MNGFKYILGIAGFLLTASAGAAVQFFNYELAGVPVAPAACQPLADQLAERMGRQTQLEIYQATCAPDGTAASKIKITYLAERVVWVESTTHHSIGSTVGDGFYKSPVTCAADLPGQVEHFRKSTGLEPFVSYCFQVGQFSDPTYGLRIEAFGETTRHPYIASATFYKGRNLEDTDRLARQISDAAKLQGVDVAFSAIVTAWPYWAVVIRHYSDVAESLNTSAPMSFDSVAGCQEGKEFLEKLNRQATVQPLALFCTAWPGQYTEVALNQVSLHFSGIYQMTAPDSFTSRSACQQKLPFLEDLYRTKLKKNVIGMYCDGVKGVFQAHVFTKK